MASFKGVCQCWLRLGTKMNTHIGYSLNLHMLLSE